MDHSWEDKEPGQPGILLERKSLSGPLLLRHLLFLPSFLLPCLPRNFNLHFILYIILFAFLGTSLTWWYPFVFLCFPSVFLPSFHLREDWLSFGSYAGPLPWVAGAHPRPSFGLRVTYVRIQLFKRQEKLVMHTLLEGSLGRAGFLWFPGRWFFWFPPDSE